MTYDEPVFRRGFPDGFLTGERPQVNPGAATSSPLTIMIQEAKPLCTDSLEVEF
jgi:hypothetical protein